MIGVYIITAAGAVCTGLLLRRLLRLDRPEDVRHIDALARRDRPRPLR